MQNLLLAKTFVETVIAESPSLNEKFGEIKVLAYGSAVNGLASCGLSDLDLTLVPSSKSETVHEEILNEVCEVLRKSQRVVNP